MILLPDFGRAAFGCSVSSQGRNGFDSTDCRVHLQRRIAARLREKQEEKDLMMEPVRSLLYLKTGMSLGELSHLLTRVSIFIMS